MMHDIDIFPEDLGGGHEKPLRHDFHLISSAKPRTASQSKRDPAGGVSMMMSKHMWSARADTSESHIPQRKRIVWATFFREKGSPLVIIGVYAPSQGHSNPTVAEFPRRPARSANPIRQPPNIPVRRFERSAGPRPRQSGCAAVSAPSRRLLCLASRTRPSACPRGSRWGP
jgi:hypothetical protein